MELTQLRYFVTIAETLSFTAAAEMLGLSQPALSYQMKRLADELHIPLFRRQGRKVALTGEGEIFLPLAKAVIARANEAVRTMQEHSGVEVGEVCMGSSPSVATHLVPNLLASFHQVFPKVRVDLVEGGEVQLQQRVTSGSMDFAIVGEPGQPQALDITPLGSEDLMVITSPSHRLAQQVSIDLAELRGDDFVLPTNAHHLAAQVAQACRRADFHPNVAYQVGSLETLKNLVRVGLAVSILPAIALGGPGRLGLATLRVKGGLRRDLYLIRGKGQELSRAAQVLLTHVRSLVTQQMTYPPRSERPSVTARRTGVPLPAAAPEAGTAGDQQTPALI